MFVFSVVMTAIGGQVVSCVQDNKRGNMLTLLVGAVRLVVCRQVHGCLFVAALVGRVRLIVGEVVPVARGKFFQEVGHASDLSQSTTRTDCATPPAGCSSPPAAAPAPPLHRAV